MWWGTRLWVEDEDKAEAGLSEGRSIGVKQCMGVKGAGWHDWSVRKGLRPPW